MHSGGLNVSRSVYVLLESSSGRKKNKLWLTTTKKEKLATYTRHGQHGIDQEWRTESRLEIPRSHILKKEITVEPVAERMEPSEPQRHQLRDKLGILSDRRPWSRRDIEPGCIGLKLSIEDVRIIMPIQR